MRPVSKPDLPVLKVRKSTQLVERLKKIVKKRGAVKVKKPGRK